MAKDEGEATRVVTEVGDWFARVPFEVLREVFLAAPDFETAAREMDELGYAIPDLIDPAVEIPPEGLAGLRDEAGFVGSDGWVRFWAGWFEPWEGYEWEISNLDQIGDDVVIDGLNRARGRESKAPVEWTNTQIWTVRQGKVARVVGYETREEALAALHRE